MQRKPQAAPVKAPTDPELAILQALAELRAHAPARLPTERAWMGTQEYARRQALLRAGAQPNGTLPRERRKTARALHPAAKP